MPSSRAARLAKRLCLSLALAGLGLGAYLGDLQATGNMHEVLPGVLYRSAQPSARDLDAYVRDYGIRTVVNLRGASPKQPWYREEIDASRRLGLAHVDFGLSSSRELTEAQSAALIALLRTAQRPILVHCRSGSDRTGLAAALFLAAIDGSGEAAAEAQLSIRYGHFSLPFVPTFAMDESFERMESALGYSGS